MIGEGVLWGPSRQIARALGIQHAVDFLGVQPPEKIATYMAEARAFVQHSQRATDGDCEGTPNTILEAQASALPVVATRHTGIEDVVVEGETGLLVDEGDVDGMAREMIRLAGNPQLAGSLGAAGRARVVDHFSLERSIARLSQVIRDAGNAAELRALASRALNGST
jgi:glycosyltransferase involved in cell wall biosynthesis